MQAKDFDLFKQKYKENCKTETSNPAILELYAYILKNEIVDSDVWQDGGGNDTVVRILEHYFSDEDWKELEIELENWTTNQLEIFTECIVEGSAESDNDDFNSTIMNRFHLLKKLLIIGEQRDRLRNDILLKLIDNIEFLNKCKSITFEEATEIANYFDYSERLKDEKYKDDITTITLKAMIEKSGN
ncbi:hypothetical protein [Flavobacterium lindanitolerans]|jgi:hypothetical protein|uniref:hypothetical protein n=1 Tax=Flavobacterium lindanitolerans TaxID=428988 RepID=UPI0028068D5A|nr:hypothetical protein [Flavobacterium lindanitolerans]MDQ7961130.1 hypothetical protein [Flavobacterium lindanitolerans]